MSYLRYEQEKDLRAIERTPSRYIPNNCFNCGYNMSPCLSKSPCINCRLNNKNKSKIR